MPTYKEIYTALREEDNEVLRNWDEDTPEYIKQLPMARSDLFETRFTLLLGAVGNLFKKLIEEEENGK